MIRFTLKLFGRKLHVKIKGRVGRRVSQILQVFETLQAIRNGNKISRLVRLATNRFNIKAILGGNLALFVLVTGTLAPSAAAIRAEPEAVTLNAPNQPISTEIKAQYPLEVVKLNQGFNFFHPGVDLDGVKGDPIRPIMKGRVVARQFSRWAYGNAILVDHGDGLQSLYAHLSRVNVFDGDEVDANTVIGLLGSTGRSTGDHLHLEVHKNGRPINPRTFLGNR
ncbi:MAG: M23 family metallopeptidase [Candidatus Blackburnbacteria bacterium]|nr:M23 family metallopeptidase [Candidatus Blackburnbacteria bacterium]